MLTKRGFLGFLGGLASWFTAKKVEAEPIVSFVSKPEFPSNVFVAIPDWCPEGFIPMLGQEIYPEQFPSLFLPQKFLRKNGIEGRYLPPYWGKETAMLPDRPPTIQSELQALGFSDRLQNNLRKEPDTRIIVHCMATSPQKASNGRIFQAGFCSAMVLERKKFEEFYGLVEKSGKTNLYLSGYAVVDSYIHNV